MLISEFFGWAEGANAGERAEAAGALAKAYLYADLDSIDLGDAERALATLLDDPSPLVRRALAEALATAVDAPHHILVALTADRPDIASLVLERSPVLSDADLIDAAAIGGEVVRCAVARRARVSAAVAGALAEIGGPETALALSHNDGAALGNVPAARLIERYGDDACIRNALAGRVDLPPEIRHALVVATAATLSGFAQRCGWMAPERAQRITIEARERATATIGATLPGADTVDGNLGFVAYLHGSGHLTPTLLMRALLAGNISFFAAALVELSGKRPERVAGLACQPDGLGFAALYRAAALPPALLPAVRAALRILQTVEVETHDGRPLRWLVGSVLQACLAATTERGGGSLAALLRRFESEAARDEARGDRSDRRFAYAMQERTRPAPVTVPQIGMARAA